jgi:hypothetical protein
MKTKIQRFKLKSLLFMVAFFCVSQICLFSQEMEMEKTYTITGEANIGDNPYIQRDQSSGNYVISFLVKQKGENMLIESYFFDKDFNFVKNDKEEISIRNAQVKYPWWDYSAEQYESIIISADEDDKLMLRKIKIQSTYNWIYLTYDQKANELDKVKLKNDDGNRYFHYRNWQQDISGEFLYILCGVKDKTDKLKYCKEFHLLKINKDLDVVKDQVIKFDYPQDIVYPRYADDNTDNRRNTFDKEIILVFAPKDEGNTASDPVKTNFTYVGISKDLEMTDRIPFKSASTGWSIEDKIFDEQYNELYFFGASLKGKDKYFSELKDAKKFDGFQVMKVSDHKLAYIKEYSLDELGEKIVKAASQKDAKPYAGKKFLISSYTVTPNGSLVVVGQNWAIENKNTLKEKVNYFDCFGLGFDNAGNFLGQYMYDLKYHASSATFQFLIHGKDPNNVYWLLIKPNYWSWTSYAGMGMHDTRPSKPIGMNDFVAKGSVDLAGIIPLATFPIKIKCDLISSDFGKIDLKNGTLSDFAKYQTNKEKKAFYYLFPKMPFILTDDHKLVLFGSQSMKKGKTLWFARLKLD